METKEQLEEISKNFAEACRIFCVHMQNMAEAAKDATKAINEFTRIWDESNREIQEKKERAGIAEEGSEVYHNL